MKQRAGAMHDIPLLDSALRRRVLSAAMLSVQQPLDEQTRQRAVQLIGAMLSAAGSSVGSAGTLTEAEGGGIEEAELVGCVALLQHLAADVEESMVVRAAAGQIVNLGFG
jgi:hypothetical protein